MNTALMDTDSLIDLGRQEWRKTPGNAWREKVWSNGETDFSDREMDESLTDGAARVVRVGP